MSNRNFRSRRCHRGSSGSLPNLAPLEVRDDSTYSVWPSIRGPMPATAVVVDMLRFYASPTVRAMLMDPSHNDAPESLELELSDRVRQLVRTWEPTTEWHVCEVARRGRTLEWLVWQVVTEADHDVSAWFRREAIIPWAIDLDTLPRYAASPTVLIHPDNADRI